MPTKQHARTIRLLELPGGERPEDVMLNIAGSKRRIHTSPKWYGKYWVETRHCGRGWFSILWPWPDEDWREAIRRAEGHSTGQERFCQRDAGQTLPIYASRDEAVQWAWTLASMKEDDAIRTRIYPWRGL